MDRLNRRPKSNRKARESQDPPLIKLYGPLAQDHEVTIHAGDMPRYSTEEGIAEILTREFKFAKDEARRLYRRHDVLGMVYKPDAEEFIEQATVSILKCNKVPVKTRFITEVIKQVSIMAPDLMFNPPIPLDKLNLQNGILNLRTRKFRQFVPGKYNKLPDLRTTIQLPVNYDEDCECPAFIGFLRDILPEDCIESMFEVFAGYAIPLTTLKKFVVLHGPSNSGKSILLHVLTSFLGVDNCSSLSLHEIQMDKFAVASLRGKLANICGELPATKILGTEVIKKLTGSDRISAQRKNENRFEFTNYARMIFSANALPPCRDKTDAYYNRFIIFPCSKSFAHDPAKGEELRRILTKHEELSGILNEVLKRIDRVVQHGITISPSMQGALNDYISAENNIERFIDEITQETKSYLDRAYTKDIYWHYLSIVSGLKIYDNEVESVVELYNEPAYHRTGQDTISVETFGRVLANYAKRKGWQQFKDSAKGGSHYYRGVRLRDKPLGYIT